MPSLMRLRRLLTLALAVLPLLAACGDGDEGASAGDGGTTSAGGQAAATVRAVDLQFKPARVRITAGEAVEWTFADGSIPHNVKGDFGMSPTRTSGRWLHRFEERGRFAYVCTIHPTMTGTVEVT